MNEEVVLTVFEVVSLNGEEERVTYLDGSTTYSSCEALFLLVLVVTFLAWCGRGPPQPAAIVPATVVVEGKPEGGK